MKAILFTKMDYSFRWTKDFIILKIGL